VKRTNGINLIQFSGCYFPNGNRADLASLFGVFAVENIFRARVFEGLDHACIIA
jgi:hypothetical protein